MIITADYHTHTIFSHGVGTIEENVLAAIAKGLKTVAITDHGSAYVPYGINLMKLQEMRDCVNQLNEKYEGVIQVLLGIEANILDGKGTLDVDGKLLGYVDIMLAGFHFDILHQQTLHNIRSVMKRRQRLEVVLEQNLYQEIKVFNTAAVIDAMGTYKIDILTHLGDQYPVDIAAIAMVAGEKGTAIEINNFHVYPNVKQIQQAMGFEKVQFVLSSDAHRPRDVGNFTEAIKRLEKSKLDIRRVLNIKI